MFACVVKCRCDASIPESITAQVIPSPEAENDCRAASALTVLTDLLMHAEISKSGQIRKIDRKRNASSGVAGGAGVGPAWLFAAAWRACSLRSRAAASAA